MSEYELLKGLSELDEELIMQPRRFVTLRMNFLFCIIAANVSGVVPHSKQEFGVIVFLVSFAMLYCFATWFLNRKRKRKLLIESDSSF